MLIFRYARSVDKFLSSNDFILSLTILYTRWLQQHFHEMWKLTEFTIFCLRWKFYTMQLYCNSVMLRMYSSIQHTYVQHIEVYLYLAFVLPFIFIIFDAYLLPFTCQFAKRSGLSILSQDTKPCEQNQTIHIECTMCMCYAPNFKLWSTENSVSWISKLVVFNF